MTFEAGNTMWPREELATGYMAFMFTSPYSGSLRVQAAFEASVCSICTSNQPKSLSSRAFFSAATRVSRFRTIRLAPSRAKMK
jgi:hypothetical protein